MTKIKTALIITLFIFSLAFTEFFLTKYTSDNIIRILEQTEISAKKHSENTENLCGEIDKLWSSQKPQIEIFLSHGEVDQIDISIENLLRYCEQSNYDNIYIECGVLKNHMTSLKDSEVISFHNVF